MAKIKDNAMDFDDSNATIEIAEKQREEDVVNGCEEKLFEIQHGQVTRKYFWNPKINEVVIMDTWYEQDLDCVTPNFEVVGTLSTVNQLVQATK